MPGFGWPEPPFRDKLAPLPPSVTGMQLIDIGANLTHRSFEDDFDDVVEAAKAAGLVHIILTGSDAESSAAAQAMSEARPGFFSSTAGFHPHAARSVSDADWRALEELLGRRGVVAAGETGLDYHRNYSPREDQLRVFERQLEIAAEAEKPVFLHQRDAHGDFLPLLKRHRPRLPGGVVHCFTDTREALLEYLALDMHIGITGWVCDERRGRELQSLVGLIPPDRLLIETDAPYLLPRTLSPKPASRRNEPRFLPAVLETAARCAGREPAEVARDATANARRLFGLAG